jgi:hypothetical protein
MEVGVDLAPDPSKNTKLFRDIVGHKRQIVSGGLKKKDGTVTTVNVWAVETRVANLPYFICMYWDASQRPKRRDL